MMNRRSALKCFAAAGVSPLLVDPLFAKNATTSGGDAVRFFFVADTHYLAQKQNPRVMDGTSAGVCRRLVETLNALPGETIPEHAGGGTVGAPRGVIHGGDLVDSADKRGGPFPEMFATEFRAFEADFGLTGSDGLLKFPVYEVHGNHDGPQGDTLVIEGIKRRNKTRPDLKHVSDNGLHYAWDWGHVHFMNLGIVVGESGPDRQRRRYAPTESLAFLRKDLAQLADKRQPIVITQHIDLGRYSVPYEKDEEKFLGMEWHPQDVHAFYETIRPFNVIADLFGHTHARNIYGWDGTPKARPFTESEIDVFNGDNASHFHSQKQAFFYVEIYGDRLVVREVQTADAWESHIWTEQVWGKEI